MGFLRIRLFFHWEVWYTRLERLGVVEVLLWVQRRNLNSMNGLEKTQSLF